MTVMRAEIAISTIYTRNQMSTIAAGRSTRNHLRRMAQTVAQTMTDRSGKKGPA